MRELVQSCHFRFEDKFLKLNLPVTGTSCHRLSGSLLTPHVALLHFSGASGKWVFMVVAHSYIHHRFLHVFRIFCVKYFGRHLTKRLDYLMYGAALTVWEMEVCFGDLSQRLLIFSSLYVIAKKPVQPRPAPHHWTGQWNCDGNRQEVQKSQLSESLSELDHKRQVSVVMS